ncbi:hypothetical protein ACFY2Q_05520 [Micromonospora sp. NPDC000316]|uniref:hypothetical protein n=1 Tax=Micromonospora sp. NPDC000316 TaxID=3364216 RepID=UPI0036C1A5C0
MTRFDTQRDGALATLSWLCHPVTLLALVVLVVNDHVLKVAFPGWVTGKLSDVAGLVLAPPLVAVLVTLLVPRLPGRVAALVGLATVGVGFAVLKSSGYAAELASSAWTALAGPSLVRADWTDLLTLPALGLSGWTWRRARRRPVRYRTARLVRLLVILPPAVLAVAATSAIHYPYAIGTSTLDGRPAISVGSGTDLTPWPTSVAEGRWLISDDGATTWRPTSEDEQRRLPGEEAGQRQGCVPAEPRRCYRVVEGHLRVEQSDDAGTTWRVAWEVSDAHREALARGSANPGDVRRHFASRDLIVYPTAGGGHEVLVANGRDGFVHRGAGGEWRRDGFLGADHLGTSGSPPALDGGGPGHRQTDVLLAVALALTLGCAVTLVGAHLAIRRNGGGRWWGIVGVVALLLSAYALRAVWSRDSDFETLRALLLAVLPLNLLTVFLSLVGARMRGACSDWVGKTMKNLLLTAFVAGLPLAGWLYGTPARTRVAVGLAVVAALSGLLAAKRLVGLADPALPQARHKAGPDLPEVPPVPSPPQPQQVPPR